MVIVDISPFHGKIKSSLEIAIQLHQKAEPKKFCHFSFIYKRNKLLAIGQNYPYTESPKALYLAKMFKVLPLMKYPMLHSEMDAVSKLIGKVNLRGLDMINIRLSNTGLKNSKPCKKCQPIIFGFDMNCYYSMETGFYEL